MIMSIKLKSWGSVALVMFVFCAASIQSIVGQNVRITIDKTAREIIIVNNERSNIVFFKTTQEYADYIPEGKRFEKCGIVSPKLPSSKQLAADGRFVITDVDVKLTLGTFSYYILEGKNKVGAKKIVQIEDISKPAPATPTPVVTEVKPTPVASEPPPTQPKPAVVEKEKPVVQEEVKPVVQEEIKPVPSKHVEPPKRPVVAAKKPEPKKENIEPADKTPVFENGKTALEKEISALTRKDSTLLRKEEKNAKKLQREIENEIAALKKIKERATCNSCNDLIDSYGAINDEVKNAIAKIADMLSNLSEIEKNKLREEYKSFVYQGIRPTTDISEIKILKLKIEEKSRSPITGWMGKKNILEKLDKLEANHNTLKTRSEQFIREKSDEFPREKNFIENLEDIPNNYENIEEYKRDLDRISVPYAGLIIVGILLILCLVGVVFYAKTYMKTKQIEKVEKEKELSGESGLLIIEDDEDIEVISYNVGLDDAREKAGIDYYEVDMRFISEDTTIGSVYLSRKVILDIYKFFSNFLKYESKVNETGCFLVGRWDYTPKTDNQMYDITIESIVEPGDDAIYGEYNLNFGAKIGVTLNYAIENLCEKTGNEYVHTCWMHSHPGLGLFLSSQDLSVQSQLAHSNHRGRLLAIVIDSNSPYWETAFFTPKQNGTMNNDKDIKHTFSMETLYKWAKSLPQQVPTPTPPPAATATEPTMNKKDIQNYYSISLLSEMNKTNKILFSGSAIIDMDTTIIPHQNGLQGYFYGEKQDNNLFIDDFKETEDGTPTTCLWVVPHFSTQEIQTDDYKANTNRFDFSVVFSADDEKIYLVTKNDPENSTPTPLTEMKEWTRRKR